MMINPGVAELDQNSSPDKHHRRKQPDTKQRKQGQPGEREGISNPSRKSIRNAAH